MKKYYYKHDSWMCLEKCDINESARIGSCTCQECEHSEGGNNYECYVICKHLQSKRKTNWKKILYRLLAYLLILSFPIYLTIENYIKYGWVGIISTIIYLIILYIVAALAFWLFNFLTF